MMKMQGCDIVVFVTAPSREEAERIGGELVKARLAACINVIDGVKSFFWWEGRVDEAVESLLIVKSRLDLLEKLIGKIKEMHSYEVPEIIALPIIAGDVEYLRWLSESLRDRRDG